MTLIPFLPAFFLASLAIAQLLPPPASPGTDACGPFNHDGDAGFSTCTASVIPGGPAPYGIVCGRDSSIAISIKMDDCAKACQSICLLLVSNQLSFGEWHWSADNLRTGCRAGIFLSNEQSRAPLPNYRRCLNQIYQPLVMSCVNSKYNIGTVNIRQPPDANSNFTGTVVNPAYPAFIVSPMALYYSSFPFAQPGVFGDPTGGVKGLTNDSDPATLARLAAGDGAGVAADFG
ncbi:MAG: hypothetical protein Q9220_004948 [cf. Caloplaca sp. 1 TL-2023]